jgi:hypothetical protein
MSDGAGDEIRNRVSAGLACEQKMIILVTAAFLVYGQDCGEIERPTKDRDSFVLTSAGSYS